MRRLGLVGLTVGFVAVVACATGIGGVAACAPAQAAGYDHSNDTEAERLVEGKQAVVLDVRTPQEHAGGHVAGDHNIAVDELDRRLEDVLALNGGDKSKPVVVYCASGRRSARASQILKRAGFTTVVDGGGFSSLVSRHPEWRAAR
jgi:phage shock protein E